MIYFLAVVGALTIGVLAWKAFGPQQTSDRRGAPAPDDDPEFLRQLGEQQRNQRDNGERGDA